MSFMLKAPLVLPVVEDTPLTPPEGTSGIFVKKDGLHIVDDKGVSKRVSSDGSTDGGASNGEHIDTVARQMASEANEKSDTAKDVAQDALYRANDAHDVAVIARNLAANADVKSDTAKEAAQNALNSADDAHEAAVTAKDMAANADAKSDTATQKAEEAKQYAETVENGLTQYVDDNVNDLQLQLSGKADTNDFSRLQAEVDSKANPGQTLASMEELENLPIPGDFSIGVASFIKKFKSDNPTVLVTGTFDSLFTGRDEWYEFTDVILTYSDYMLSDSGGHVGYLYDLDGNYLMAIGHNLPVLNNATLLPGYNGNGSDVVTFYMSAYQNTSFFKDEKAFLFDGEEHVEVALTSDISVLEESMTALEESMTAYVDDNINDVNEIINEKAADLDRLSQEVDLKASSGQTLASMEELEALPLSGDVSEGVVYMVVEKVPNKPCLLITGKFSDYFSDPYGDGVYYEIELDSTYSEYFIKNGWVVDAGGYGTCVYNADDYSYVGEFSNGVASGCEVTNLHGYSGDPSGEVSFYICSEYGLEVSQEERSFYYNGEKWIEMAPASNIGDIDSALDSIILMQDELMGGNVSLALDEVLAAQDEIIGGGE